MSLVGIRIEELSVTINKTSIINDASVEVKRGRCLALLGSSGSGKTTLLRVIAGFIRPDRGRVSLLEKDVTHLHPEERPVSMLFQEPVLFPHLTVRKNATVGFSKEMKLWQQEIDIKRLARAFEIDELLDRKISSGLSGGQKQRAALLRTFTNAREILLLDEPLKSALNVELRWKLMRAIRTLVRENNRTTLIVTHDFEEAAYLADEIAVFADKGRGIFKGSTYEMYYTPPNLEVARVLGKGTEIDAETIFQHEKREAMCPFTFENGAPHSSSRAHTVFIRPDKIALVRNGFGFTIRAVSFLGEYSLVELVAKNSAAQNEIQIFVSVAADLVSDSDINEEFGAKLSADALIVFDQNRNKVS